MGGPARIAATAVTAPAAPAGRRRAGAASKMPPYVLDGPPVAGFGIGPPGLVAGVATLTPYFG